MEISIKPDKPNFLYNERSRYLLFSFLPRLHFLRNHTKFKKPRQEERTPRNPYSIWSRIFWESGWRSAHLVL
uniref:Uncharacterized protein n=1 Tax=Rhizophora mucronata TaxID=61149 RepID=A0A2P2LSL9_RHIMU